jgi:hypothetical protein
MIKRNIIALIYIFLFIAIGCGKKAPPRPPNVSQPNPPTELSAKLESGGVLLKFKLPLKNDDGSDFTDFKGVEIYKVHVTDTDSFCANCDEGYELVYEGEAKVSDGYISFIDKNIDASAIYFYKVKVVARRSYNRGLSSFSAPLKVSVKH